MFNVKLEIPNSRIAEKDAWVHEIGSIDRPVPSTRYHVAEPRTHLAHRHRQCLGNKMPRSGVKAQGLHAPTLLCIIFTCKVSMKVIMKKRLG